MAIDYQNEIRQVQEKEDRIRQEIRSIEQHREDFFRIQQQEQRLYAEIVETSPPEERHYYRTRGEESFSLAKKAQRQLEEQTEDLKSTRKQLIHKEEELSIQQRQEQMEKKE